MARIVAQVLEGVGITNSVTAIRTIQTRLRDDEPASPCYGDNGDLFFSIPTAYPWRVIGLNSSIEPTKANGHDPVAEVHQGLAGRSVVFVGMMGSGKTAIGRETANLLKLPFFDSDDEIELAAGRTIPEIFAEFGEAYFRSGEERVIDRLISGEQAVIALGGGAFLNDDTRELVQRRTVCVWIHASLEILGERVRRRPATRPLLAGGNVETKLRHLVEERKPFYRQAPVHVRSKGDSIASTACLVIERLQRYLSDGDQQNGNG